MRFCLLAMLGLLATAAHGQAIFKCKQKDGSTAYQDHSCPGAADARPDMTIKPSNQASGAPSSSQRLTPQQRAQLLQALVRLKFDLQQLQAKRGEAGGTPLQSAATYVH